MTLIFSSGRTCSAISKAWRQLGNLYGGDHQVETARSIIRSDFAEPTSIGIMRLREHSLFQPDFPVADFIAVLKEIFQV